MFVWDAFAATEQQLLRYVLCEDSFCQAENRVNLKGSLVCVGGAISLKVSWKKLSRIRLIFCRSA